VAAVKRVLLLAGVVVVLALPATASAKIVVQRGIGGVSLGMTGAKVRALLGRPASTATGRNEFGPFRILFYSRVKVTFQGLTTVTAVETTSPLERTTAGIGVGSTKAQVRTKVAGVVCEPGHCHIGKFNPGARVTDFFIGATGRVTRVLVGFVID
jgi:hypothetical protein